MYNDTIKVANKIISDTDLADIFQRMDEEIRENQQICRQETMQNEKYEREYQHWTTKDFEGKFNCTFNFYDDTNSNDIMSMVDSTNQSENGINQNNQGPHIKKEKLC